MSNLFLHKSRQNNNFQEVDFTRQARGEDNFRDDDFDSGDFDNEEAVFDNFQNNFETSFAYFQNYIRLKFFLSIK